MSDHGGWRKRLCWLFLGLLVLLGASGAYRLVQRPAEVAVVFPERGVLTDLLVASGRLRALRTSQLNPEITGIIRRVRVDQGDRVKAGDVLVELDDVQAQADLLASQRKLETARRELRSLETEVHPTDLARGQALLEQRQAVVRKARTDYARYRQLLTENAVSRDEFEVKERAHEEAQAQLRVAQQELRRLQDGPRAEELDVDRARIAEAEAEVARDAQRLAKHRILAPFSGLVTARQAEPGQGAALGQPLLTLADTDTLEIYVETDELNLKRLRPGLGATVIPPAHPEQAFSATLALIESQVDSARGVIGLRLKAPHYPGLPINATVDVNIETQRLDGQWLLPASAVAAAEGQDYVVTIAEGRARHRAVKVLARSPDRVAVADVETTTPVVLRAADLREGARVRPAAAAAPAQGPRHG